MVGAKTNNKPTPTKNETTKVVQTTATTNNKDTNNTNKKRKEPEPKKITPTTTKETKETTPKKTNNKTTVDTTPKKQQEKPTTPPPTKETESKKQPQPKKQKSEPKPTTTTTPVTEVVPTPTPSVPAFSLFDSLKNTSKATPATTTSTPTNNKSKKPTTTATSTTTTTNNNKESSLLKAFSKSNQYSEPDVKLINEKIEDVLKEIKESSPEEITRKEQKDKIKLKKEGEKRREEQNPRTIFVSNLNLENANDRELKQIFKAFGSIESLRFRSIPLSSIDGNRKETFIKKEFHEKRETCNAYIVYKSIEEAKKAVKEMNGKEYFGKHLRVDMADHKPTKESDSKTIFIGNIPYETEEEELFLIFDKSFGDVLSVRIVRDKQTNIGKGFGYVNFSSEKTTLSAIAQKSITFNSREIRIFPTKQNPKKGKTIKEKKKLLNKKPSTRAAGNSKASQQQ